MRLYLSSDGIGDRAGSLLALLGATPGLRAAVIANGFDSSLPGAAEGARGKVFNHHNILASLGIAAESLDLRAHFGDAAGLAARLARFDLVWVMGGNAFVLRRAMRQSGFDQAIADLLARDALVYAADGAGALVSGPSLLGAESLDDPWDVPEYYDEYLVWSGLRLTSFTIVPHFRSNHPDSAGAEKLVNYLGARRLPYRALSDGEVVVSTGARGADRPLLKRIA